MKPLRLAKQVVDHAANVLRTFEIREMSAVLDRGQLGIRQGPGDVVAMSSYLDSIDERESVLGNARRNVAQLDGREIDLQAELAGNFPARDRTTTRACSGF